MFRKHETVVGTVRRLLPLGTLSAALVLLAGAPAWGQPENPFTDEPLEDPTLPERVVVAEPEQPLPVVEDFPAPALFQPTRLQGALLIAGFTANRADIFNKTLAVKADIISPYYLYITPAFVDRCHKQGLRVVPWTVNRPRAIAKMIACGVDGIISDYPDRLYNIVQNWQEGLK